MANFALNLGSSKTGLTDLRGQWLDSDLAQISIASSGFDELGSGQYTFAATVPNGAAYIRFYSNASPADVFFTLAVQSTASIPASGLPDTVVAYLYTRNASGDITPAMTVNYQLVGVDADYVDAWDDEVNSIVSDGDGLAEITMVVGGYYRYWITSGRFKTVHITDETADPYALPQVTG